MEIKFRCVIDTENSLFEPVPAKKVKPEWYKDLPAELPLGNGITDTIKKCPAMHDWLSMGYLIRNRHTILVWMGTHGGDPCSIALPLVEDVTFMDIEKIKGFTYAEDVAEYVNVNKLLLGETVELSKGQRLGGHPHLQVKGSSWDDKMCFKFKMDFLIETPKGTSCYYLDPFLFDNPNFTTWQGVIDTDNFNQLTTNNMIICYPKADEHFIITKGTPLVQIVPFVRYPWKHTIEYLSPEELNEMFENDVQGTLKTMNERKLFEKEDAEYRSIYRKNWASKKEFK